MMDKYLAPFLNKGVKEGDDTQNAQQMKFHNSSLLMAMVHSSCIVLFCYVFSMDFGFGIYIFGSLYFFIAYLFTSIISLKKATLIHSIVITIAHLVAFTYYGFSYGLHFLFLCSIFVSIANIKSKKYRHIFYTIVFIGFISTCLFLLINGHIAPKFQYELIINLIMFALTIFILIQNAETFAVLLNDFEAERFNKLKKLESKNEEFKSFNYTVAHDLKSPLRTISSFTTILMDNIAPEKKQESEASKQYIDKGIDRMNRLLEDLMTFIEATDKEALEEEVDLNIALKGAEENLFKQINDKKAIIKKMELPTIKANASYCLLLFQNFLANAMKFIEKDKHPQIEISAKKVNDGINILIQDNGIGIAKNQQKAIFGTFKRLNSKDQFEGSGLGLSLCQKIVQFWDGEIKVDSELGQGTTFKIFIPNEVVIS